MHVSEISLDDAKEFLSSRTLINSNFGRQLERLRDGESGGGGDTRLLQSREERRRLRLAKIIRCIDGLCQRRDVRHPYCPDLRRFAERTGIPAGEVAVRVLYAYEQWDSQWPEKGLVDAYSWMRSVDPKLRAVELENGCAAQAFRVGKSVRARRAAASLVADAHVMLAKWIDVWNKRNEGRGRLAA